MFESPQKHLISKLIKLINYIEQKIIEVRSKLINLNTSYQNQEEEEILVNIHSLEQEITYKNFLNVLINVKGTINNCILLLTNSDKSFFISKYLKVMMRNFLLIFFNKDIFLDSNLFDGVPIIKLSSCNYFMFGNTIIKLNDKLLEESIKFFSSFKGYSKKRHIETIFSNIKKLKKSLHKVSKEIETNIFNSTIEDLDSYCSVTSSENKVMRFLENVSTEHSQNNDEPPENIFFLSNTRSGSDNYVPRSRLQYRHSF